MRWTVSCILLAVSGAAFAEGSDLKAGLWELTQVRQIVDGRDMSDQMAAAQRQMQQDLAGMPPDQRKQMEATMAQRGVSMTGKGGVGNRVCISHAMAARDKPLIDPQGLCQPSKVDRSGNTTRFEFNCTNEGRTMAGKGEDTVGNATLATRIDMTVGDAYGRHSVHSETQMKYLGPDCLGVKPADELAKETRAPEAK